MFEHRYPQLQRIVSFFGAQHTANQMETKVENEREPEATCAVCLQEHVLPVRLPCSHVYCFLCAKGLFLKGRHCALCRQLIDDDFFRHPELAMLSRANGGLSNEHAAEPLTPDVAGPSVVSDSMNQAPLSNAEEDVDTKPVISELAVTPALSTEEVDVKGVVDIVQSETESSSGCAAPACSAPVKEPMESHCWFYAGRNGWWKYDERTNAELERVFTATPDGSIDLLIVGTLYHIDLAHLVQFQRENPTLKRRIKRDRRDTASLGVAGLKL